MGWIMQRVPRQCQFLPLELEKLALCFSSACCTEAVALKSRLIACSARLVVDRYTQTKYRNPHCACAPRVNKTGVQKDLNGLLISKCKWGVNGATVATECLLGPPPTFRHNVLSKRFVCHYRSINIPIGVFVLTWKSIAISL